ncbi:MAG: hypothetical protein AB7L09_22565 [Nitrospira sp.]|jgi:hypothetical protein
MSVRGLRWVHPRGARMVGAALCVLLVVMGGPVLAHVEGIPEAAPSQPEEIHHEGIHTARPSKSKEAGLQAASWVLTLPYGAAKAAYAIGGAIVGGLAWAMTGGTMEVGKSVWIPSMTGDYIVQPQHLTREKPLHFLGVPSGEPSS